MFSDTYVQIKLYNIAGEEIATNRTGTKFAEHQPVFAEKFTFNIQPNSPDQITLYISVINKSSVKQNDCEFGWVSFGMNLFELFLFIIFLI